LYKVAGPEQSVAVSAQTELGNTGSLTQFVPVESHPGFYYKAVHLEVAAPEQSVAEAAPTDLNIIVPAPLSASVAASPNQFDDGLETQGFIHKQPVEAC
jgi:hypothetical protein